jgi:hypothetical protein
MFSVGKVCGGTGERYKSGVEEIKKLEKNQFIYRYEP